MASGSTNSKPRPQPAPKSVTAQARVCEFVEPDATQVLQATGGQTCRRGAKALVADRLGGRDEDPRQRHQHQAEQEDGDKQLDQREALFEGHAPGLAASCHDNSVPFRRHP